MSLVGGIRGGVEASKGVVALLLLTSDLLTGPWELASSFCFPVRSAGGLLRGLHQIQDPGAIAIEFWL